MKKRFLPISFIDKKILIADAEDNLQKKKK